MAEENSISEFTIFDNSAAFIQNNTSNLKYIFRYNLINSEGTQVSEWSSINYLEQDTVSNILQDFTPTYSISSVESGGVGINIKWTVPDSFVAKKLDIYLSWSYNSDASGFTNYEYIDSVTSNSYYIDIPYQDSIKAKFVKIVVQLPTNIKIINENAMLFESSAVTTLPILDGGTII